MLTAHIPEYNHVLSGRDAIIRFLFTIGITNGRKQPLKWRTIGSWAKHQGFPLLPGAQRGRTNFSSITSQHAIIAWILSRTANGYPMRAFKAL
jgi:hypothetical protein